MIMQIAHKPAFAQRTFARKVPLAAFALMAVLLLAAAPASAQTSPSPAQSAPTQLPAWQIAAGSKMEFEVASIHLGDPGKFTPPTFALNIDETSIPPGGHFKAGFTLPVYIEFAYKLMLTREERDAMLAHLPKWVGTQPFVIDAKAPMTDATKDQMRLMMQSLLADRFKLAVHFETQGLPAFALVAIKPGKTGPRLRPHAEGLACDAKWVAPPDRTSPSVPPGGFMPTCGAVALLLGPNHTFILGSRNITMDHLAQYLPTLIPFGRPIIDRTGLTGSFDFSLQFAPEPNGASTVDSATQPDLEGPTAFEALKEQLGLTLKPIKASLQTLVIDHVEQPSPN
jgi:bla regulator protein blaR1